MDSLQRVCVVLGCLSFAWSPTFGATPLGPATFGNPDHPWGTRRHVTPADKALIMSYRSGKKPPVLLATFADPAELQSSWALQSDDNAALKSCRRPMSIVTSASGLKLQTRAATDCRAKWSTGSMISRKRLGYGFYEASVKIADVSGLNNAFWVTTDDHFEIDIAEIHYPNDVRLTLHNNNDWATIKEDKQHAVGFDARFRDDFSASFHDYGVLWTAKEIIFEVDGDPVAAIVTNGSIKGPAQARFSTAVGEFGGKIPDDPTGHEMDVKSLKVIPL